MIRRVAAHFVLGLRAPWRSRLVAALLVLLAATVLVLPAHLHSDGTPAGELRMLLTWTLVGLWHGFAPHYALWGILNGFLILMESFRLSIGSHWPKAARIARTFLALCLIRVLFRADSLKSAGQFYVGLFRPQGGALPLGAPLPGFLVAVLFALFFIALELHEEREGKPEIGVSAALTLTALGIACVMIFGCYGLGYSPTEFFYNRF